MLVEKLLKMNCFSSCKLSVDCDQIMLESHLMRTFTSLYAVASYPLGMVLISLSGQYLYPCSGRFQYYCIGILKIIVTQLQLGSQCPGEIIFGVSGCVFHPNPTRTILNLYHNSKAFYPSQAHISITWASCFAIKETEPNRYELL